MLSKVSVDCALCGVGERCLLDALGAELQALSSGLRVQKCREALGLPRIKRRQGCPLKKGARRLNPEPRA